MIDYNPPCSAKQGEYVGTNFERKYIREGRPFYAIAAMKKGEGGEEWFYAEYTGTGKVLEAGEDFEECLGCHAAGHDYVLAF